MSGFWAGPGLMLLSGVMNGSFALPMRWARKWEWENIWLVFSTVALVALPAAFAFALIPNLGEIYRSLCFLDFMPALGFGLLWGVGQATFGIAIRRVGMAMAFALVVGIGTVLASIVPLAVLHPSGFLTERGAVLVASAALLASGLAVYGRAARDRERAGNPGRRVSHAALALCIASGVLGASINFGFAFSGAIERQAVKLGATAHTATLAVWVPVLGAGAIPNLLYSVWLLRRNRTASRFRQTPLVGCALAAVMGVLWSVSTLGYGWGSVTIGLYGTSAGYAIYDSSLILWSTILGILAGEWRDAPRAVNRAMRAGVALILAAVLILSISVK